MPNTRPSGRSVSDGYAMLMRLNRAETAIHECLPFEWKFWMPVGRELGTPVSARNMAAEIPVMTDDRHGG